ncbi:hypothetical protein CA600_19380 [Paenibacillus sp. VTT E-133280]|uniref:hypothetical protein n=1 Tax=Paenibacillus TaxID=44249 RepID=UPI000B9FC094|nr:MULTISPECIES: hypothetical protein [unclassified Paenibacillus]MDH6369717.1 c-di-AMP phosphodiesterase-like protein [Paenibacillus sp. PastF-3]OZQ63422.1 hypothetical protein CA600_19380 [Paenibacillus sp. VTT E-133280]OZQ93602.1 hypothetical protein CA598_09935 [Paenibacillus sp. VTT E-133291]
MKKILSRIAVALLILTLVAIVTCFYIGELTYAYLLILVLFFVFAGMGQLYKLKNDEYMYKKLNKSDQYENYTR